MNLQILKSVLFAAIALPATVTVPSISRLDRGFPLPQEPQGIRIQSQPPSVAPGERRNIGAFFTKLRTAKPVTVAYVGGSSAAGLGAGNPEKNSYRALVTEWLQKNYPKSRITEINAGVAYTGSLYATLRARRDLIADKPDLVFVDMATSDGNESEAVVKKAVEGLLRQLLIVPQPPEVMMIYGATPKPETEIEWYDVVAAHYQLPALNLQNRIQALLDSGKFKATELWKNGGFLSDSGHRIYADQITAFLAEQAEMSPTPIARTLPGPLVSDELNYGEFRTFAEIKHDSLWKAEPIHDRAFPTELLIGNKPGSQIELFFEGTVVGLSFRSGPDAGIIECQIDGKPAPAPLSRIDCFDTTNHIGTRIIAGGLGLGEHRLTIRILPDKNARSTGNNVRLGYLLFGGTRPERL